jgi:hypothetical protein
VRRAAGICRKHAPGKPLRCCRELFFSYSHLFRYCFALLLLRFIEKMFLTETQEKAINEKEKGNNCKAGQYMVKNSTDEPARKEGRTFKE